MDVETKVLQQGLDDNNFKVMLIPVETIEANHSYNTDRVLGAIANAVKQKCQLLVVGEMVLNGYCCNDLLFSDDFYEAEQQSVAKVINATIGHSNLLVIIGSYIKVTDTSHKLFYNVALAISNGVVIDTVKKNILANSDVFFETRYFINNNEELRLVEFNKHKIGILICEDIWHEDKKEYAIAKKLKDKGASLLVAINASPYQYDKLAMRQSIAHKIAGYGLPFIYANIMGGREEIVFDGNCLVSLPDMSTYSSFLSTTGMIFDPFDNGKPLAISNNNESVLYCNLSIICYYIKAYLFIIGLNKIHLGLSGGVDSALVASLAVQAVGADNVLGILLPSRYSSSHSIDDAKQLAKNLGIKTHTISIENLHKTLDSSVADSFALTGLADENSQSRLRGLILMAYSNANASMLLTTGNKCELATGYGTLYGDMNGAINPIGDFYKGDVYSLCRYINEQAGYDLIPNSILTKEPSAELRAEQKDSDSLPDYDVLDSFLKDYLEDGVRVVSLQAKYGLELSDKIIRLIKINEFKRKQAPPILKISKTSFGVGRRYPLIQPLGERKW